MMDLPEIEKRQPSSESSQAPELPSQKKASDLDIRCSDACIRAGLTALLFSALAVSMLQPLMKQKAFDALGKYITLRLVLKTSLDDLTADPCWQDLMHRAEGNDASRKWNVSKIMEYQCSSKPKESATKPMIGGSLSEQASVGSSQEDLRPAAPAGLRITYPLWSMQEITQILTSLGNGELLTLARSSSNRFNYSIYKWVNLRHRLLNQNLGMPIIRRSSDQSAPKNYVPSYLPDKLLKQLTLEDVKNLADYEFPT